MPFAVRAFATGAGVRSTDGPSPGAVVALSDAASASAAPAVVDLSTDGGWVGAVSTLGSEPGGGVVALAVRDGSVTFLSGRGLPSSARNAAIWSSLSA